MTEIRLRRGKAEYVTRKHQDGRLEIVCLCEHNADLSRRGCISQVPGEYIQDVMDNNGQYSEEVQRKLKKENDGKLPDKKCRYCDSRRHNYGGCQPNIIGEKTKKDFELLKPAFVRISKNSEAGHILYRKLLINFLELCKEHETRAIFPTKMLEFDERVARLLRETESTLFYSLGWNRLEPGACSQGFTNEWRIKQAQEYALEGVNTSLTIVCDVPASIGENVDRGNAIGIALNSQLNKRVIPLRPNSRKVAPKLGINWDKEKYVPPVPEDENANLFDEDYVQGLREQGEVARYLSSSGGKLIARYFHPDFYGFRDSLSVCGRVGDLEYCDKCNTGLERVAFPASELVPVIYGDEKRKSRRKYRAKKKKQRGQLKLF